MKNIDTVLDHQTQLQQEGSALVSRIDTLYADYNRLYDDWLMAAALEAAAQLRGKPEDLGAKGILAKRKRMATQLSTLSQKAEQCARQIRESVPEITQAIAEVKARMEPFQKLLDALANHQATVGSREGELSHRVRSYTVTETGKLSYPEAQKRLGLNVGKPCAICGATDTGVVGIDNGQPVLVCLRASCRREQPKGASRRISAAVSS